MMQEMQAEYDPPSVVDLGSLVEITRSLGSSSAKADGGGAPNNKTA
jgi:hypothetical protein